MRRKRRLNSFHVGVSSMIAKNLSEDIVEFRYRGSLEDVEQGLLPFSWDSTKT